MPSKAESKCSTVAESLGDVPTLDSMALSTTPFSSAFVHDGFAPDLRITSVDDVDYHVHAQTLLAASTNAFGGRISRTEAQDALALPETSVVLDLVFRIIYAISCLDREAPLETTEGAIDAMIKYGISVLQHSAPTLPLGQLILSYTTDRPIEVYALAAHHQLESLAVLISSYLLSYDIATVPDALAVKMGPVHLRRLFTLHRTRLAALRGILLLPPARHPVTPTCDERAQRQLDRVWAFATAEIIWNALPSITTQTLAAAFEHAGSALPCADCREMVRHRSEAVVSEWSAVKSTI